MKTFSTLICLALVVCGVFDSVVAQSANYVTSVGQYTQMMQAIQNYLSHMDTGNLQKLLENYGGTTPPTPAPTSAPKYKPPKSPKSAPKYSAPKPDPKPAPKPDPEPAPKPVYNPEPAPKPVYNPEPAPKPAPKPDPAPAPKPAAAAQSTPAPTSSSSSYGSWTQGTATYYTTPDNGSCGYGPLPNSNVKTGTNIAAISSIAPNYGAPAGGGYYKAKSCGLCYEVKCSKTPTADGTGEIVDSQSFCYDKSIVVTISDTCPLDGNPKCGATHLDLAQKAFDQIAQDVAGQIAISYRQVDCSYSP